MTQFLANTLFSVVITACTACSFYLLFKPTRFFQVTHGICILASAYAACWIAHQVGGPLWIAAPLGVLAAGVLGLLIFQLYGFVGGGSDRPTYVLLASIAMAVVIQNLFSMTFGDQVLRLGGGALFEDRLSAYGAVMTGGQVLIAAIGASAIAAMLFLWYGTAAGRNARAIADDPDLARIVGVPVRRTLNWLAFASSFGAGVTGLMVVLDTGVNPASGLGYLLPGLIAAVVGGGIGVRGVLVAAILVSALSSFTAYLVGTKWSDLAVYALLAMFLILRPAGIEAAQQRADEER